MLLKPEDEEPETLPTAGVARRKNSSLLSEAYCPDVRPSVRPEHMPGNKGSLFGAKTKVPPLHFVPCFGGKSLLK